MVRKLLLNRSIFLGVAQLVARSVRDAEAVGSSPITLTIRLRPFFIFQALRQIKPSCQMVSRILRYSALLRQTSSYIPSKLLR